MKRVILIVAALALVVFSFAMQAMYDRATNLKKIEDLCGEWDLKGTAFGPAELGNSVVEGTMHINWVLQKSSLQIATKGALKNGGQKHPIEALGLLTYNDEDFYDKQCFVSSFSWDQDGRMIRLTGQIKKGLLTLTGSSTGGGAQDFEARIFGQMRKTIEVDASSSGKKVPVLRLVMTRRSPGR